MWSFALVAGLLGHVAVVSAQTWCNKGYMANETVIPPGGQFPIPGTSDKPLISFRCTPAIKPYLAEDTSGSFIIDTLVTHAQVNGAVPFNGNTKNSNLIVSVQVNGKTLAKGSVPVNSTGHELSFSLHSLKPQKAPFDVTCTAQSSTGQTLHTSSSLQFLPMPKTGGVTKMDSRTGGLLVNTTSGWEPLFALGFYTSFDGYLTSNLSVLNDLKSRGFTIVHPVPTFDNLTALEQVLDRMEEVGLFLMYDMRFTYMNLTSVTEQVNMIKSRKNLLLWYTGDEPDGTSDPLNATKITYDHINDLDGYHPVSLVLNCQDYQFSPYIQGADIVMEDPYPIAINATFSVRWGTPCTPDFGDCGCDNCIGQFEDASNRIDQFKERLAILGDGRTKALWHVPQAFGGSEYWARAPTGNEWLVQAVIAINHGALGIVPWMDPTPPDIKESSTMLAKTLPTINQFLFNPKTTFRSVIKNRVDVGVWTLGTKTLVLGTNLNYATTNLSGTDVGIPKGTRVQQILNSGGSFSGTGSKAQFSFSSVGSAGFIFS